MVSSQLLVAIDASRLSQGEIGSGNFDPTEDAASRNWSPTAARMKNIKAIMIKPAQIIAPVMPSSWPRLTFLISPLKDTELIAKRIENAGQIRKLIVEPKLKPGLRFVPPLLAVAITLSNAPVPARASKLLLKLKTPAGERPNGPVPSAIYFIDSSGNAVALPSTVDPVLGTISAVLPHFSLFAAGLPPDPPLNVTLANGASHTVLLNVDATATNVQTVLVTEAPANADLAGAKRSDLKTFANFFHASRERGVYFPPSQFETAFISTAHTAADIERTARVVSEVVATLL